MSIPETPNLKEFLELYGKDKDRFVFFTGSGLSMPLFSSWSNLLTDMVETAFSQNKLRYDKSELIALIEKGEDFLDISEICAEALGAGAYRNLIEKHFAKDFEYDSIPPAYKELFDLQPKLIVTTNYDLIPNVAGKGTYSDFTNKTVAEANRAIEKNKKTVVKIHGDVNNHESLILTRSDYSRIINNESVKNFLRTVFTGKTVLFIGFGLNDMHLDLVLSYLNTISSGIPVAHYAVMPVSSQYKIDSLEKKYGIKVIPYNPTDSSHPEITQFLQTLGGSKTNPNSVKIDSPKELCYKVANLLKTHTGNRSFVVNYEPGQRCLYISFETRAYTEYELQKELISLVKTFDFDSSILDLIIICVQNPTSLDENIDAFYPVVLGCSMSFQAVSNFVKGGLAAQDFWGSVSFFIPRNVGVFTREMNVISFPYIGAATL